MLLIPESDSCLVDIGFKPAAAQSFASGLPLKFLRLSRFFEGFASRPVR
jgi:hypothetical protein